MAWLSGYGAGAGYRKPITIDHTVPTGTLTNFTKLVKITSDAQLGSHCDASGNSIRFTAADGTTLLNYGILSFSISAGLCTAIFWVQIPSIDASTDKTIYLYYKASGSSGQSKSGALDSNTVAYAPCTGSPTGSAGDIAEWSTNALNLTSSGMDSGNSVAGLIGNALHFSGLSQTVKWPSLSSFFSTEGTVSMLIKLDSSTYGSPPGCGGPFGITNAGGSGNLYAYGGSNYIYDGTFRAVRTENSLGGSPSYDYGQWHHLAITSKAGAGNWIMYVNGVSKFTDTGDSSVTLNSNGSQYLVDALSSLYFPGSVQHCFLSSVSRPAAWIKYQATDMLSNSSTFTLGAEQADTSFSVSPSTIPSNHSGNMTLSLSGTNTVWDGTTVFNLSGVDGVTKVSQQVLSNTSARVVVSTK